MIDYRREIARDRFSDGYTTFRRSLIRLIFAEYGAVAYDLLYVRDGPTGATESRDVFLRENISAPVGRPELVLANVAEDLIATERAL